MAVDIFIQLATRALGTEVVKEYIFHPTRKWRFDYAVPAWRIALEVEGGVHTGGRHIRPKGFLGDMEKYNAAAVLGWRVLRCVPDQLLSKKTTDMIAEAYNYETTKTT